MSPLGRIAGAGLLQLSLLVTRKMSALQRWLADRGIEWEDTP